MFWKFQITSYGSASNGQIVRLECCVWVRLGGTAVANLGSSCLSVTKSQEVSKPLRQMKECSVFKHTYALQEVLARGLQCLRDKI
jgi:hypothetical protein